MIEKITLTQVLREELKAKVWKAGGPKPGNSGRTSREGTMDMITPLIDEIASLRIEVNSLKNQQKE